MFIDESGFYLLPTVVRTYGPKGMTPLMKAPFTKDHLSTMCGISTTGHLYSLSRAEPLSSYDTVAFIHHLQLCIKGKLLLIWDGSPIHRGDVVKKYLEQGGAAKIHIEPLPPYAPDLNPAEGVWNQLKLREMRNLCCMDLHHLHSELSMAIERLRTKPSIIQGFFARFRLSL